MNSVANKISGIVFLFFLSSLFSCSKETNFGDGKYELSFNADGRNFSFYVGASIPLLVNIQPGSVNRTSYLFCQYGSFGLYHYDTPFAEINQPNLIYLESQTPTLENPATIILPINNLPCPDCEVYFIDVNPGEQFRDAFADPARWTIVGNHSIDASINYVEFESKKINGCFVFARFI
jgi:hypothetical protein